MVAHSRPSCCNQASAAASSCADEQNSWVTLSQPSNLSPLTGNALLAAKRALIAVPSGLSLSSQRLKGRNTTTRHQFKMGSAANRFYNTMAARPIPRNGISLEQSMRLEMCIDIPTFLTTSSVGLAVGNASSVTIAGFSGAAALLAVFDQYRIDQLEVWLEPVAAQGTTVFGSVVSAVDLDDANAVTGFSQVQDHPCAIQGIGGAGHYHKWRPHTAVAIYSGAFTSFSNEPSMWIDSGSPNVQHYGLKACTIGFAAAIVYSLTVRAVVSVRAPVIS
jgi:hypothetical protein